MTDANDRPQAAAEPTLAEDVHALVAHISKIERTRTELLLRIEELEQSKEQEIQELMAQIIERDLRMADLESIIASLEAEIYAGLDDGDSPAPPEASDEATDAADEAADAAEDDPFRTTAGDELVPAPAPERKPPAREALQDERFAGLRASLDDYKKRYQDLEARLGRLNRELSEALLRAQEAEEALARAHREAEERMAKLRRRVRDLECKLRFPVLVEEFDYDAVLARLEAAHAGAGPDAGPAWELIGRLEQRYRAHRSRISELLEQAGGSRMSLRDLEELTRLSAEDRAGLDTVEALDLVSAPRTQED